MRERPQQPSREVLRGGVSRPATAEPVPLLASTGHRRCRWRRRSRPLRRSPSGRPQDRPHPQQPSREVQRGGLSRPAPAEPVPPPASTSRRHCRRRGRSRPQRRLHRDLTPAALLATASLTARALTGTHGWHRPCRGPQMGTEKKARSSATPGRRLEQPGPPSDIKKRRDLHMEPPFRGDPGRALRGPREGFPPRRPRSHCNHFLTRKRLFCARPCGKKKSLRRAAAP